MARHHGNHSLLPEMVQPNNEQQLNEPLPLGQNLFVHAGNDTSLKIGPSYHGNVTIRSNDIPSSSRAAQFSVHRVKNTGALHNPYVHCPAGSSHGHVSYNAQTEPVITYPHGSEEEFAPVSSQINNRTAAVKRKNLVIYPEYSINGDGYYAGSSSSTQFSNYLQPAPFSESLYPQMPPSIGPSNWNDHSLVNQGGIQRNVRQRHNFANISLESRPVHSTSNASQITSMKRNGESFSTQMRTMPSGASGMSPMEIAYGPMGSSNSTVPVPTSLGSSGSATFTNGVFAPRAVHANTGPSYVHLPSVASSSSTAIPHEAIILSYPPATSATTSTSMRANQPFVVRAAASSRHARNVPIGHANSGRNRRARNSYYAHHPLIDAQHLMIMQQLALRESREAQDPHRGMRLDIDNMSYEDLLALGESIGNVSTGLADEKISGCVREVIYCSSDEQLYDQDDGKCAICLEEYKDNSLLGILKCNHDFHTDCIKQWLKVKNSCPICKAAAA
ncbi:E3 ubiquitin-protein ligase MBR2-like [Oryza brachyantha]|uniref:RING-type E3 ubiquitin transferase n=1 Tax=Oryza brachyantha TaxID=4533 RepID=J3KWM2_ORYBR|nr:E3 ubiquitin-protein ligase MBR2-like [Oryza brachyantha]